MSKYLVDIKEVADGQETDNEYVFKASNILMSDNTDVETAITNKPGEKYLVENVPKGEIFNDYTNNKAPGDYSHAEGYVAEATGKASHAEGGFRNSRDTADLGDKTYTSTDISELGDQTITVKGPKSYGLQSHAEGTQTLAYGYSSHAEGYQTIASGMYSHAEGRTTTASAAHSHAECFDTIAQGDGSHAEGHQTIAQGDGSHAEGGNIGYSGSPESDIKYSSTDIAELEDTITISGSAAYGIQSHAEGTQTFAYGYSSHAEGYRTIASGMYSHAEGGNTVASDRYSHVEGYDTTASGAYSHAEGFDTIAQGDGSHAEGRTTTASGDYSHAEGYYTRASGNYSHVEGKYNVEDTEDKYAHITGGGTSNTKRKNIYTLDWEGNATFAGDVTCTNHLYESRGPASMGIVDTDTLDDIVEKIPSGTLTTIWINGATTYGQEVRNGIGSSLNVYGNMFVHKTKIDGTSSTTTHFVLMSYTSSYIFIRSYSTVNDNGWSGWKKLTLTDV